MAGQDFEIASGGGRVRVEGLSKTVRALGAAGADAAELKDLMFEIGSLVVAASDAPELSGSLDATVRAGRGKTKAVVRAGGARAPYAGVIHYGWPERGIEPRPFLLDAMQEQRPEILSTLDEGLDELLRRHNLK